MEALDLAEEEATVRDLAAEAVGLAVARKASAGSAEEARAAKEATMAAQKGWVAAAKVLVV